MRFASLSSGSGNYAAAAKPVVDSAANAFTIMRRSGPDYAELSKVAMNTRTAEKMAAMKAGADMATAGIKAVANVTQTGIQTAAGMKLARDKAERVKMAGKVAGIGAVLGGAVMAATNKKEDTSWKDKHYAAQKELQLKRIAMLDQEDADDYGRTAPPSMDGAPGVPEQPSVNSGGGGGSGNGSGSGSGGEISSAQALASGKGTAGSGSKYSVTQMQSLLEKNGMKPENARILAAVGMGESGGNSGIDTVQSGLDPNKSNEYSLGLFQINAQAHGDKLRRRGWTVEDLRDPSKNAAIAVEVFREAGNSFRPWSVYQKGLHKQYLQ